MPLESTTSAVEATAELFELIYDEERWTFFVRNLMESFRPTEILFIVRAAKSAGLD